MIHRALSAALAIVVFGVSLVLAHTTYAETHQTVPSANFSFIPDLQNFLSLEDANREKDRYASYVISGGIHSTAAGLTGSPSALVAYLGGIYTTESGTITYPNNSTCWVITHYLTTGNQGSYTRVSGTNYLINCASSVPPTLPDAYSAWLMKVVTSGGAITSVTDLRALGGAIAVDGCQYSTINALIDAVNGATATVILHCPLRVTSNKTSASNITWRIFGSGEVQPDTGVVFTINSPEHILSNKRKKLFSCVGTETCITFTNGGTVYPDWWGVDGTADQVQFNQAIGALPATARSVIGCFGPYYAASTITVASRNALEFQGMTTAACPIYSLITGSGASPLFSLTGNTQFITFRHLDLIGNGLTGASGNGHAIYINGAGANPFLQFIHIVDTRISYFKGTGLDRSGSSVSAAGVYAAETHSFEFEHAVIENNQYGLYFDGDPNTPTTGVFKANITKGSIVGDNLLNGFFCQLCEGVTIDGESLFSANGSGGTSDGNVRVKYAVKFTLRDARLKEGDPYEFTTDTGIIEDLALTHNYIQHYTDDPAVRIDSGTENWSFDHNRIQWAVPDVTAAKGLLVDVGYSGANAYGCRVVGNRFRSSANMTMTYAISFNIATQNTRGCIVESNVIGEPLRNGSGSDVITKGIYIGGSGVQDAFRLAGNVIGFSSGGTVTTAIHLDSNGTDHVLQGNQCIGTVTTCVDDDAQRTLTLNDGGVIQWGINGTAFANLPASPANGMLFPCLDCTSANPCASGGSGALAFRTNGAWKCLH